MKRLICILILVTGISPPALAADRPNVLFIAIDDLNDWVGCLGGHPNAKTPNIDRLAARGTLFTNANCQAPTCGPSRASFMSGLHAHTTGVYAQPRSLVSLSGDQRFFDGHLLTQHFAANGYRTLGGGKIMNGYPINQAFEVVGPKSSPGPKSERQNYFLPDLKWAGTQTDWGAYPDVDTKMPDHKIASWAVEQLGQKHDKPFFLAVGFVRPHVPFYVPQKWFDQFPLDKIVLPDVRSDDLDDVPAISRAMHELPKFPTMAFLQKDDNKQFRLCVQAYLACSMFVDHQVGRVLDALDKSPHAKNTIVVLFSDHGYHLGEKHRVAKHSLWEEAVRVPLIVSRPGDPTPKRCGRPVGLIDLYPTLLDLCELPEKTSNEGQSLVPLLNDPKADWRFATLTTYARENHTLRSENFRYIRFEDGSEELYDHRSDPNEWKNLAGDADQVVTLTKFRQLIPKQNAPYHKAVRRAPINAWFENHYKRHPVARKQ
jgi:arylsulfatase A-like enzyme